MNILARTRLLAQKIPKNKFIRICNGQLTRTNSPTNIYTKQFHSSNRSNSNKQKPGWTEWRQIVTKFLPVGLCLVAVMQWRAYRKYSEDRVAKHWEIRFYCNLPLRTVSRCWGWIADKEIPELARPYVYGLYSTTYGVNIEEAENEDLKAYPSLADFFSRPIKENIRVIDPSSELVAPCDGTVLHYGLVKSETVEQVKGVDYSLKQFLGENAPLKHASAESDYKSTLHHKRENTNLYHCVIYLAPGDYHRFHSPTEWKPTHRRHFHGELLSVNPKIAKWIPGLFCLNERVVYFGEWKHGFFSYTAVGATNVGSVKVYFDKNLKTNCKKTSKRKDDVFLGNAIKLKRGEIVGEFRMGSTIVLIFEAPDNFQFTIHPGDRVKMGSSLGTS